MLKARGGPDLPPHYRAIEGRLKYGTPLLAVARRRAQR
jgi:hypothetical protein